MNLALDRRGHLSEWALERLRIDDPQSDPEFFREAEDHLRSCDPCRASFDGMVAEAPALTLAPKRKKPNVRWLPIAGAFAMAALVLVIAWPRGSTTEVVDPGIRAKGSAFDFEVRVATRDGSTIASDGGVVHPGDRLAFKARAEHAGVVTLYGLDAQGARYPIMDATRIEASEATMQLNAAIELDAVGARETLVAVYCKDGLAPGDPACITRTVTLEKRP